MGAAYYYGDRIVLFCLVEGWSRVASRCAEKFTGKQGRSRLELADFCLRIA